MGKAKYVLILIAIVLAASLVLVGLNCSFPNPFAKESTPSTAPTIQYGDGEPLISVLDLTPIAAQVAPAVVFIEVEEVTSYWWFFEREVQRKAGSGVIYSSDGYILTNYHVVGKDPTRITVTVVGKGEFDASIVTADPSIDLAVLKINLNDFDNYVKFTSPDNIAIGQWVLAFGYPFGLQTVSEGIVSGLGISIELEGGSELGNMVQTTAAINPGNSGGPLVNLAGEVVGINTAIIGEAENIGFAISVETIEDFLP